VKRPGWGRQRSRSRRSKAAVVAAVFLGAAALILMSLRSRAGGSAAGDWTSSSLTEPLAMEKNNGGTPLRGEESGPRMRIAFAIVVTKDGPFLDGAAVLKESVELLRSIHRKEFVAIVHSGVQETRPALERVGFKIMEFEPPLSSSEIEGKHLRETIDNSGCCGTLELLKLRAFQLLEYDRIILTDSDFIFLKSLDHTVEAPEEIQFTYDHAMDGKGSAAPPAQGGFFIIKPNLATYERLVDVVREGDFRPGTGWGGTNIGWCWGYVIFYPLVPLMLLKHILTTFLDRSQRANNSRPYILLLQPRGSGK